MSSAPHKKNLGGGKGHKKQSNKERGGVRKNRELAASFIDDITEKRDTTGVILARIEKVYGVSRVDLLSVDGKAISASVKGSLRCNKAGGRREDNPTAVAVGRYALVQEEAYGKTIIGVIDRADVKALEKFFPAAAKNFFDMTATAGEEDAGFDWDEGDEIDIEGI